MPRPLRLLAPIALVAMAGFAMSDPRPDPAPRPGGVAIDTTLSDTTAAGSVLIRALPDSIAGEAVASYRAIVIPARGWLVDRSFFWRVPSDARGPYTFLFGAVRATATDSVRLQVTVTAPE